MSYEHAIETLENDVLTVAVQGSDGGYVLWQKGLSKEVGSEDGVYFEWSDQINGAYNQLKKCIVTSEAIQVSLANGQHLRLHLGQDFDKFSELKSGLKKVYEGQEHVLEFSI